MLSVVRWILKMGHTYRFHRNTIPCWGRRNSFTHFDYIRLKLSEFTRVTLIKKDIEQDYLNFADLPVTDEGNKRLNHHIQLSVRWCSLHLKSWNRASLSLSRRQCCGHHRFLSRPPNGHVLPLKPRREITVVSVTCKSNSIQQTLWTD